MHGGGDFRIFGIDDARDFEGGLQVKVDGDGIGAFGCQVLQRAWFHACLFIVRQWSIVVSLVECRIENSAVVEIWKNAGSLDCVRLVHTSLGMTLELLTNVISRLQRFDDGIVKSRANLFDGFIRAIGPGAVGQQSDGKPALGVDPEGCAGVSEVAISARREVTTGL